MFNVGIAILVQAGVFHADDDRVMLVPNLDQVQAENITEILAVVTGGLAHVRFVAPGVNVDIKKRPEDVLWID